MASCIVPLFHWLGNLLAALRRGAELGPARLRQPEHVARRADHAYRGSLFFRLVSYRYGWAPMLVTTDTGIADWAEVLADGGVLAMAILDRLLHRIQVLSMSVRSYRLPAARALKRPLRDGPHETSAPGCPGSHNRDSV
jgi:hypothetical protein